MTQESVIHTNGSKFWKTVEDGSQGNRRVKNSTNIEQNDFGIDKTVAGCDNETSSDLCAHSFAQLIIAYEWAKLLID